MAGAQVGKSSNNLHKYYTNIFILPCCLWGEEMVFWLTWKLIVLRWDEDDLLVSRSWNNSTPFLSSFYFPVLCFNKILLKKVHITSWHWCNYPHCPVIHKQLIFENTPPITQYFIQSSVLSIRLYGNKEMVMNVSCFVRSKECPVSHQLQVRT